MKLRIGTLNCQNNKENRDIRNDNANVLATHIINNNYSILGTQELTINFTNRVKKILDNYKVVGRFQFGKGLLGTKLPIIRDYNQGNQIITNLECISSKTYTMPWIPTNFKDLKKAWKKKSLTKRIITILHVVNDDNDIYIMNTHLDYYIPSVQQRQLNYIYKKIIKYQKKGFVVLMGDFNLDLDEEMFNEFINKLDSINIKRVPVNDKTNASKYSEKSAIDHIFIPSNWNINNCGTFDKLDITDHKAVYVDIEI